MDHVKLQEFIWLYGAEIKHWPELLQQPAQEALLHNPALRDQLEEARVFEKQALMRPMLRDDSSFAERIIAIARTRAPAHNKAQLFWEEFKDMVQMLPFPKPAYSLATFAVMGLLIGIASQEEAQAYSIPNNILYEVGEVL